MNNVVLQYKNVSVTYKKGIHALKKINLTIKKGESIVLCGHNGSGKTTLLKAAAGLLKPSEGMITLAGNPLNKKRRKEAFHNIGFVFQDSEDQLFCPTVKEDIAYGPINMGLTHEEVKDRIDYGLNIMKIKHLADRPIHHLSGGEKKRVALAGILAMNPPIMVMDEPINGLDPKTAADLIKIFNKLHAELGYTLIVASHEIDKIPDFAERIVILKEGEVHRDGTVREIFTDMAHLDEAEIEAPIITRYFAWLNTKNGKKTDTLPLTLSEACE